jgi:hypothetical protein
MNVADQLNAKGATAETILQIMGSSVFEASGDLSEREMRSELEAVAGKQAVAGALAQLQACPEAVGDIALLWIAAASEDPKTQPSVAGAISDADREMPLLEIGAVTLLALYAIHKLAANKPKHIRRKRIVRHPDGRFEELHEEIEHEDFSEPVKGLLGLFRASVAELGNASPTR